MLNCCPADRKRVASRGLDIAAYTHQWHTAQSIARRNRRNDEVRLLPYWERVRVLYLELGGGYIKDETTR